MAAGGGTKAIVAAFLANLGIAIAKFVGYLFTASASMLAESIHSLADTGNQGLLLLGGRQAKKEATEIHPFGYGRERYFWAFVVALVLFSVGGLFSAFEGIEKIRHPHEIESVAWAIGILSFGIVVEGFSFRMAIVESRKVKGDLTWPEFIRRSRQPELPVVLLEDLGAMIGLVAALGAVITADVTGDGRWDGVGSLTIGVLLCLIAAVLAVEMKSLLIGEAVDTPSRRAIVAAIEEGAEVTRLIHLRTQHLGPDDVLVAARVEFDAELTVAQLADAVDAVEARVRSRVPAASHIYLEPDLRHTGEQTDPPAD